LVFTAAILASARAVRSLLRARGEGVEAKQPKGAIDAGEDISPRGGGTAMADDGDGESCGQLDWDGVQLVIMYEWMAPDSSLHMTLPSDVEFLDRALPPAHDEASRRARHVANGRAKMR
jgi:hypothetical protein